MAEARFYSQIRSRSRTVFGIVKGVASPKGEQNVTATCIFVDDVEGEWQVAVMDRRGFAEPTPEAEKAIEQLKAILRLTCKASMLE